jgi:hypothetical protein
MDWHRVSNIEDLNTYVESIQLRDDEFINDSNREDLVEIRFPYLISYFTEYAGGCYNVMFMTVSVADAEMLLDPKVLSNK